ncbi:rRNA-processing protein sof1 [Cyanidiococcus yangmingshanensis]|uniref:rRNA-processing protein sof1 n=1 Tax=Cyanidiococcus yangmingshanensis TaxID=2690220 RepID=A0A7J7IF50_9RHOD|nr:rRNA-processing protein sof1 [Cyanidiococcus yangmingshanensis]
MDRFDPCTGERSKQCLSVAEHGPAGMRVHCLTRSERELKETAVASTVRNLDPVIHPFERAREYKRALNAAKIERVLARPLVSAHEGHADGIYSLVTHPRRLADVATASGDGEVRVWRLSQRTAGSGESLVRSRSGHTQLVCGLAATCDGRFLLSASQGDSVSSVVQLWRWPVGPLTGTWTPVGSYRRLSGGFGDVTASPQQATVFATGAEDGWLEIWDYHRSEPLLRVWSHEQMSASVNCLRYHPSEAMLLAACLTSRDIALYDTRQQSALARHRLPMRCNDAAWNPMEPFQLAVACDDHDAYLFDIRRLDRVRQVYRGHVGPVLCVSYAPTGHELCTGSYDGTVRIFDRREGASRDIYHTKRMQHVFRVQYTGDARFILSASDDGDLRVWKSSAADPLRQLLVREKRSLQYARKLRERHRYLPQVRRVLQSRFLPRRLHSAAQQKREEVASRRRKEAQRQRQGAPTKLHARANASGALQ